MVTFFFHCQVTSVFSFLMRLEWPCFRTQMSSSSLEHLQEMEWCRRHVCRKCCIIETQAQSPPTMRIPSMSAHRSSGERKCLLSLPRPLHCHFYPDHPAYIFPKRWIDELNASNILPLSRLGAWPGSKSMAALPRGDPSTPLVLEAVELWKEHAKK